MGGKKVYRVAVCKVCGLTKRCNGGTCSACRSRVRCRVCGGAMRGGGGWCAVCQAALCAAGIENYGGDHRPARERERVIARYARRAAAGEPIFRRGDRA